MRLLVGVRLAPNERSTFRGGKGLRLDLALFLLVALGARVRQRFIGIEASLKVGTFAVEVGYACHDSSEQEKPPHVILIHSSYSLC